MVNRAAVYATLNGLLSAAAAVTIWPRNVVPATAVGLVFGVMFYIALSTVL